MDYIQNNYFLKSNWRIQWPCLNPYIQTFLTSKHGILSSFFCLPGLFFTDAPYTQGKFEA